MVPAFIKSRARQLASKSEMQNPMAAIIYDLSNYEILGEGWNRKRSFNAKKMPIRGACVISYSYHAEVEAGRHTHPLNRHRLKGAAIYVLRLGKDGKERLAKPCPSCMAYLERLGIKEVYYSE